jgi:large subunit ribosomal protein L4
MAEARIYSMSGEELGVQELPDEVFGTGVSTHILWEVVRAEQLNRRQGTVATLSRSMVHGSGKKPWRQKHTGRARSGSAKSPIWRGGGVAFGPRPRTWNLKINRKVRKKALSGILTERLAEGNLRLIRDLVSAEGKTADIARMLENLDYTGRRTVILTDNPLVIRASENIPRVDALSARNVHVGMLVNAEIVLLSEDAVDILKERVIEI